MDLNFRQYEIYKILKTPFQPSDNKFYTTIIDNWYLCGWIPYREDEIEFELLKTNSLKIDHGEIRLLVPRSDDSGVNCYCKETN